MDTPQVTFLTGLNTSVAAKYGAAAGLAFRHMLEIGLIKPTPPDQSTKWLKLNDDIVVADDGNGGTEVTGSLTFEIEYRV